MAAKRHLYIGIDGGATSSKLILINENEEILSTFTSGSCNKNNIGFDAAKKNVNDGIIGLLTLAKQSKSDIKGVCMTTAGCTLNSDKIEWKKAIFDILGSDVDGQNNKNIHIEVHNDSVGDVASVCPKRMCGIVCIVGTGFIVCGYNGDPNIEYRAGGWGPLFGDDASGYFIGEKVLRAAALFYDICGNAEQRYMDDQKMSIANEKNTKMNTLVLEYGASKILYDAILNKSKCEKFPELVDWAYNAKDKYMKVADLALIALQSYNECKVAKQIIDNAVDKLIMRLVLILDKMHPIESFDYDKMSENESINVICGGSILLKSNLFLNLLKQRLNWKLGGDGRQRFIKFVRPKREPQLGGALYIKHKCESKN